MNHQDSRSVTAAGKLFSLAALALAVGLAGWGTAALAVLSNYDRDPGNVDVRKKGGGKVVVVPIDPSGNFSVRLKELGQYTLSAACKQKGCPAYTVSLNSSDTPIKSGADGTMSYEFAVGKGGLELSGQILSVDLPKGVSEISRVQKDVIKLNTVNDKVVNKVMSGDNHGEVIILNTSGGGVTPGIADQGQGGVLTSYRTAPPPTIGDDKPTNKYADDFKQLNTKLDALATQVAGVTQLSTGNATLKAQVTALQTAVADLPTTASITALNTSLTTVNSKIDAITTTLNTVATAGTATKAIVDGFDGLKTDLTALTTKVAADNLAMKAKGISPPPKNENAKPDNDDRKNGDIPVAGFGTGMNAGPMSPGGPMGPGAGPMGPGAGPMSPGAGPMSPGAGPMSPGAGPMSPGGLRP